MKGIMIFTKVFMCILCTLEAVMTMEVNFTIFSTKSQNFDGDGLWLFCVADKPLRDVDWYQNGARIDDSREVRQSDFECPAVVNTSFQETCEISGFSNGFKLYVPNKFIYYTDIWSCLAEPAETGYPVTTTPKVFEVQVCDSSEVDLVLLLDGSGSVGVENFQIMLQFVKEFLWFANTDTGRWRVGVLRFDSSVSVQFHLNNYTAKLDILNAVGSTEYLRGFTYTAAGLNTMHNEMFSVANGDRPEVQNIAILLTDGLSNRNKTLTIPEADAAKQKGITIYTVSIELSNKTEVEQIASDPYSKYGYVIDTFDEIKPAAETLFRGMFGDMLCEEPIPNLTPTQTVTESTSQATTDTASTTSASPISSQCACPTSFPGIEISQEVLSRRVEERKNRIRIDPANTTLNKGKYTSARDDRTSATAIGYVSIALMSVVFVGVVSLDFIDVCRNRRAN